MYGQGPRQANRVIFDGDGSYIRSKERGEITMLNENGGMYELALWVRSNGFQWPGMLKEVVGTESRRQGPYISL